MIDLVYLRQRAAVHSRMKQGPHSSMMSSSSINNTFVNEEWRRYGKARRKEIVEKDKLDGGNKFELNHKCRVQRYFKLAERVSLFCRAEHQRGWCQSRRTRRINIWSI
jgi:hypothetical protein